MMRSIQWFTVIATAGFLLGCSRGPAPKMASLQGLDLDGKEFSLADYKGKVILLDFWGHW